MKLGILLENIFDTNIAMQGMDFAYINKSYYPAYSWANYGWNTGKQIIWEQTYTEDPWSYYKAPAIQRKGLTNVAFIKWIFDIAAAQAANHPENKYDYGTFLLSEEMYNPITTVGGQWAAWRCKLNEWVIDGTADLGGQHIEALKPWYVRTKGAWNQTWWDSQVATNQPDATTKAWANEYYFKLHKAWVAHMHNIGKKAAIIGFTFAEPNWKTQAGYLYGSVECWKWVLDNYDFVMEYTYPMCMPPTIPCITGYQNRPFDTYVNVIEIQELRSLTRNILAWNLTTRYPDGYGSGNIELQRAEFNRVAPYVNVITAAETADQTVTSKVLMSPRLVEFAEKCPPATLKMTIEPVVI